MPKADSATAYLTTPNPQSHCRPYQLESRMRENRLSGSEGGAILTQLSLPLSIILSLRDEFATAVSTYRCAHSLRRTVSHHTAPPITNHFSPSHFPFPSLCALF